MMTHSEKKIYICAVLKSELIVLKKKIKCVLKKKSEKIIDNAEIFKSSTNLTFIFETLNIGKINATLKTCAAINKYQPDIIVHFGCCGVLKENIKLGAIILPNKLRECDSQCVIDSNILTIKLNQEMPANANIKKMPSGFDYKSEGILSADTILLDKKLRDNLSEKFNGFIGYDMESYAVARTANFFKTPIILAKIAIDYCAIANKNLKFDNSKIYDINEIVKIYNQFNSENLFKKNMDLLAEFLFELLIQNIDG